MSDRDRLRFLATLTAEQHATIERELVCAAHAADRLLRFVPRATPGYSEPRHLAAACALMDRARRGESVRATVFAPPRHAKSDTILHGFALHLLAHPTHLLCYATHTKDFAAAQSRNFARIAERVGLTWIDKDAMHERRNEHGGGVLFIGTSGAMGRGFHLLCIDDPIGSRTDAESPRIRDSVWDDIVGTLEQRLEPRGSMLLTHQRWHDDDPIGRMMRDRGAEWEHLAFPAIDKAGNALWPARYPATALEPIRRHNAYNWASQYIGIPMRRGGSVFTRADAPRFDGSGRDGRRIMLAVDCAGSEGSGDFTVAVAIAIAWVPTVSQDGQGVVSLPHGRIVDMLRMQLEPADSARNLAEFQLRNGAAPLHIERTRDGKSVAKVLRALDPRLMLADVDPIGDKYQRAQPIASAWNDGRIELPAAPLPWVVDLLDEFRAFSGKGDKHDDIVDACAHAWNIGTNVGDVKDDGPGQAEYVELDY